MRQILESEEAWGWTAWVLLGMICPHRPQKYGPCPRSVMGAIFVSSIKKLMRLSTGAPIAPTFFRQGWR